MFIVLTNRLKEEQMAVIVVQGRDRQLKAVQAIRIVTAQGTQEASESYLRTQETSLFLCILYVLLLVLCVHSGGGGLYG